MAARIRLADLVQWKGLGNGVMGVDEGAHVGIELGG